MNLYPSIKPPVITKLMRNIKLITMILYKTALWYSHHFWWFVYTMNPYFITVSTLLTVPPSIRIVLNHRKMAALLAIQRDSHILTLTGLSLGTMRLLRVFYTVLVWCLFDRKKWKQCAMYLIKEIQFVILVKLKSWEEEKT